MGWRDTPMNANTIGRLARSTQPYIEQIFIRRAYGMDQEALERKVYVVRKRAEDAVSQTELKEKSFFYIPSLRTYDRLQGSAARAADCELLRGALEPGSTQRPLSGSPALLDEHLPHLAFGASLPLPLSQR